MTDREFDTMLRFKAGAGIVPLCQWVRELRADYESEIERLREELKKAIKEGGEK